MSTFRSFWHSTRALSLLVILCGAFNLLDAVFHPSFRLWFWVEDWLPFSLEESSRVLLFAAAILQLALGRGLWRRKRAAWQLVMLSLLAEILLHLGHQFNWPRALLVVVLLALLWGRRGQFVAQSDRPSLRWAWMIGLLSLAGLAAFGFFTLRRHEQAIVGRQTAAGTLQTVLELIFLQSTDTQFAQTEKAEIAFAGIQWAGLLLGVTVVTLALRPVFAGPKPGREARDRARRLVDRTGRDPMDEFLFQPDKRYFFHGEGDGEAMIAYALWRNVAVALGSPVGLPAARAGALRAFRAFCRVQDWHPVFYALPEEDLELFRGAGLRVFKVAEDARLDLRTFSLKGGAFQNLRTARNKGVKSGLKFETYPPGLMGPRLLSELSYVSQSWLAEKHGMEMTFDLGAFSIEEIARRGVSLVRGADGAVQAFATWLPYAQGRGRCLDLMRTLPEASGAMDVLLLHCLEAFQAAGVEEASLGNAPLANIRETGVSDLAEERALRLLFEHANHIYGYKSLFEFKKKYHPDWKGRYLAYGHIALLPLALMALVGVHVPKGLWKMIRS
jgi:lysylphosphatidylglycerol synthetase-like protein (DUF2156 family)